MFTTLIAIITFTIIGDGFVMQHQVPFTEFDEDLGFTPDDVIQFELEELDWNPEIVLVNVDIL